MTEPNAPPPGLAADAALFLDFDGTLVELAEAPDLITVPATLPDLLVRLSERLGGRVAILSGRALADLERHLGCTGFAVSGSHGLELRLPDGRILSHPPAVDLSQIRAAIARFAAERPGLLVEDKPAGIAVHFRQAPELAEEVSGLLGDLARERGLALQHGKAVIELRPAGADKGDALRALMAEPPFIGARPLFVGDDLTDEHGFAAAAALGGAGLLVGTPRASAARWLLPDVAAVAHWLAGAVEG
jgi:trehalose 6-phosphate phosphatase